MSAANDEEGDTEDGGGPLPLLRPVLNAPPCTTGDRGPLSSVSRSKSASPPRPAVAVVSSVSAGELWAETLPSGATIATFTVESKRTRRPVSERELPCDLSAGVIGAGVTAAEEAEVLTGGCAELLAPGGAATAIGGGGSDRRFAAAAGGGAAAAAAGAVAGDDVRPGGPLAAAAGVDEKGGAACVKGTAASGSAATGTWPDRLNMPLPAPLADM